MTHTYLRQCLALNAISSLISSRRALQLVTALGSLDAVFAANETRLLQAGLSERAAQALQQPDWAAVEKALCWANRPGRYLLTEQDDAYPQWLRHISDPPLLLFCEGDIDLLNQQSMAVVGSRAPTPIGLETAQAFATQLARLGFVIISGMALGIDTAAHRGALTMTGRTIAVLGTGLDRIYPARNTELAAQIRRMGLLISEFPLGTAPLARNFPQRNRIISGLSRGVLVVEAGIQSGSLITARMALDQGREVFAIPGSIHNPTSKGCHLLLRDGAKLVQSVDDILEEIDTRDLYETAQPVVEAVQPEQLPGPEYSRLLAAIDTAPTSVESIIERSGLTSEAVCSMLLTLEMRNFVHMTAAGQYCRAGNGSRNERKHTRYLDVSL